MPESERYPVPMPMIPPAKHHLVDLDPPATGGGLDKKKLLAVLDAADKRQKPYNTTSKLVRGAIYGALADRIRQGEFS